MSADIVDKLQDETYLGSMAVARDAAAEIERLRAALRKIAEGYEWSGSNCRETALEALNEQSPREGTLTPDIEEWAADVLKGVLTVSR